jgi:ribonuclease-3
MRMFRKPRRKMEPAPQPPPAPGQAAPNAPQDRPLPQGRPPAKHFRHPAGAEKIVRERPAPERPRPQGRPPLAPAPQFSAFEREIRYFFRRQELLEQALTHSSFAYEKQAATRDNELLEFLGDSVIGLIAADFFYSSYQDMTEGDLSKLKSSASSTVALAEFAKIIKLDKYIHLGRGEERSGGRKKSNILADVFEAVVGAIYLDGGYEASRGFFLPLLESTFHQVKTAGYTVDNYKSALQEYLQKEDLPAPQYKVLSASGPEHNKVFTIEVCSSRTSLAKAKGPSRKAAEQKAAELALKSFMGKKIKSFTAETFIVEK